jgi:heme/copper-type cytochrome/quinol oxidase subunit 3
MQRIVPIAPSKAVRIGMWTFLASLAALFASSLLGYLLMRFDGPRAPRAGALVTPVALWWSTAILAAGGWFLARALASVRRERQTAFRRCMLASTVCGFGFLVVQGPALFDLLRAYEASETRPSAAPSRPLSDDEREFLRAQAAAAPRQAQLYAVVFTLIVLHALHVLGGLLPLVLVTMRAYAGRYDHEVHTGVLLCTMYWHFLDAVWFVMFAVFAFVG